MTRPKLWHAELKKCFHWFTDCPGKPNTEHFLFADFNFKYRVETGWQIIEHNKHSLSMNLPCRCIVEHSAQATCFHPRLSHATYTIHLQCCIRSKTLCSDFLLVVSFSLLFGRHVSCDTTVSVTVWRHAAVDDGNWTEWALKQLTGQH